MIVWHAHTTSVASFHWSQEVFKWPDGVSSSGFHFLIGYVISVRDTKEFAEISHLLPTWLDKKTTPKMVTFAKLSPKTKNKKEKKKGEPKRYSWEHRGRKRRLAINSDSAETAFIFKCYVTGWKCQQKTFLNTWHVCQQVKYKLLLVVPIPRLLNNALPWTGVRLLRNSSSNMVIAGLPAASMTAESNTVCLLLLVCQMETPVSSRKGSSILQGPQYCVELQDHCAWPYHESGSERYERDCQLTLSDSLNGQMVNISTSDVEKPLVQIRESTLWFYPPVVVHIQE